MIQIYDIYNPTPGVRTIYDGIEGSQREIRVRPHQTVFIPTNRACATVCSSKRALRSTG